MKLDPKKIGAWSSAIAGVAGIAWAVVKAVLWAGALTASIKASAADIISLKRIINEKADQQAARVTALRTDIRRELSRSALDRRQQAVAISALKAEMRVRASRSPVAEVQEASEHADSTISTVVLSARSDTPSF